MFLLESFQKLKISLFQNLVSSLAAYIGNILIIMETQMTHQIFSDSVWKETQLTHLVMLACC